MYLRKLCIQSLIVLLLTFYGTNVFANTAEPSNSQTKSTKAAENERLIFHLAGSEENVPITTAIELLMRDRLLSSKGINLVPMDEVLIAAEKGKALSSNNQILSRHIPYLCLKTDTSQAVLGWVDIYEETIYLSLQTFDGISAINTNGTEITGNFSDISSFIDKSVQAFAEINEKQIKFDKKTLVDTLDLPTLHQLGQNWLKLKNKNKKDALIGLIIAKEQGGELANLEKLAGNTLDNLGTKDTALLNDLLGNYQKALVAYSSIKEDKANADYHFRHAYLLLKQGQYQKLRSKLKTLEKIARKDERLNELNGWHLYQTGHKNLAISKWRSIQDAEYSSPEIYNLIAADALDRSVPGEAAETCIKLADYYHKRQRFDLESSELLKALNYGGSDELLDRVRLDLLNKVQKENLKKWLDSQNDPTPHHMLMQAKLLLDENQNEKARDLLLQASATANEEIEFELGQYFLNVELDIDRSISFLKMSRKVGIEKPRTSKALAEIYLKAKFCYKSIPFANEFIKKMNYNPRAYIEMSDILVDCGNREQAIKNLQKLTKDNQDYSPALAALAKLYHRLNDEKNTKETLDKLKRINRKLADSIFATPKEPEKKVIKEVPKENKKEAKPKIQSNRAKVKVEFPATEKLVKIIPTNLGRIGLINFTKLKSSLVSDIISSLTNPNVINTAPIENDFVNLIQADSEVVEIENAKELIKFNEGSNPFRPDSFDEVMSQYKLDAVALYEVNESADKSINSVNLKLYTYIKEKQNILNSNTTIVLNVDKLITFNLFVTILPILGLIAISIAFLTRKKRGTGKLVVKIKFDRSFEDYYFAVRISSKTLESPFKLDKLMKQKWAGTKSDTEQQIEKFFKSHSGSIAIANNKIAGFDKVLTGNYHIYVAGIMVNIDNQKPLTSYEVHHECKVERDKNNETEINFDIKEAYIDIRITKEVKTKKKVTETVKGQIQEVTREVTRWEEVAGAMVSINNDPAYAKTSIAGEPVSYTLPFGEYRITATFEDLGAIHNLVVEDTETRTIELRLIPQLSSQNAEILSQSKGLSKPPKDLQQGVLRIDDTEPMQTQTATIKHAPSELPFDIDDGLGLDDSDFGISMNNQSSSLIEPIELSEDILSGSGPMITHDTTSIVGDNTQIPIDTEDLFKAASQIPQGELAGIGDRTITEAQKREFRDSALKMKKAERWDEAAELYLRAGDYDAASEMAQKSGNQIMNYKIYGVSYLKQGQFREAAEMFKYAEEPLLEAEALEGLRLFDEANKKRGIYWESLGDITRAMKAYEKAGAFDRIAMLHEHMQNFQQAGQAYFKARDYAKAAECFISGNDIKSAAEAFEMNGEYEKAAEYFQKLGSNVKVFNLLEKSGKYCEAAEGYKKFGLLDEAVHACQQVLPSSEDYLKAALIMGKIFTEKNEIQLARSVYHKVVENADITQSTIEKYYEFGVLIQEQGQTIEAFALFERLQTVKYNYADVTIRMQNLQEQIEKDHSEFGTAPPPGTIPPFPGYRTGLPNLSSSDSPRASAGQTPVSSRYAFEQELGRGAMGIVYKAKDTALDRLVAYKTVSNAIKDNPASLKYFLSEAKSLAALNHGNIVTVFDVGQENSNYYITMEYVDGRSLADFIREKGRLSTRNCVVIATKICSGLEYAHMNNVVHRDIKPSNIMISNKGDVKIMDFGLAKIMTEAVQDKTVVRGTPLYMSPEQVEGIGVDHTSDIYSFGVTMFEMATGTLPFTKGDIAYHHLHTEPPSPIRYNPSIPQALEKIILKCLSKKKEERYQTSSEIKRDLAPLRAALMKG